MANVYVDSNAAGAGTGADWTNAYTTLNAALTAKAAGDTFWVAHNHAETAGAAKTHTSPGTAASPCFIYCVNSGGSVPPVSADLRTTATITTTGNNAMAFAAFAYCYGIAFSCGSGAVNAATTINSSGDGEWIFQSCAFIKAGTTGNASAFTIGSTTAGARCRVILINTTFQFGATGDGIVVRQCGFIWRNTPTAIAGATLPTTLFSAASTGQTIRLEGVDLSALGSGKTLVQIPSSSARFILKDCKLGSSVTIAGTPSAQSGGTIDLIRCDSGDTNYRTERYRFEGTETTETTIILTGGASDGTTGFAKKIVTTANAKPLLPFEAIPVSFWNETLSSITVTLQGIWGGGAVPNNNDIWAEFEYLGTSGVPLGAIATCGLADPLATAAGLSAGSGTWGGSTTKFKLAATFTPQEKGPITIYVKAGAASGTFYVDPKPVVT